MNTFKKYRSIIISAILAVLFALLGMIFDQGLLLDHEEGIELRSFEKVLHQKQRLLKAAMKEEMSLNRNSSDVFNASVEHSGLADQGIFILNYYNDSLVYWSDNLVAFDKVYFKSRYSQRLVKFPNGWYLTDQLALKGNRVVGLIRIKKEFSYENRYLHNELDEDFFLAPELEICKEPEKSIISVRDAQDNFLFGLRNEGLFPYTKTRLWGCVIFNLLAIIFCLVFVSRLLRGVKVTYAKVGVYSGVMLLIYLGIVFGNYPQALFFLKLFSPVDFAVSDWLPSLGAFTIASLFIVCWALFFVRNFSLKKFEPISLHKKLIVSSLWGTVTVLFFEFVFFLGYHSVFGSNLSVGVLKEFSFSASNLLYTFNIGLLLVSSLFVVLKFGIEVRAVLSTIFHKLTIFFSIIVGWGLFSFIVGFVDYVVPLLYVLLFFTASFIKKDNINTYRFSFLALLVMILTVAGSIFFSQKILERNRQIQHLLAENIASEHDPAAEMQLLEIEQGMEKDTILPILVTGSFNRLNRYMRQHYFSGYLRNFDLQITLCSEEDSVLVQPENSYFPCYDFFSEMLQEEGMKLPGEVFYFMDKRNARVSYLGQKIFPSIKGGPSVCMYMEISSTTVFEGVGFPELLEDDRLPSKKLASMSYAKYSYGSLVDRYGEFSYNYESNTYPVIDAEFSIAVWDDYDHFIYNMGDANMVIVSMPHFGWVKLLKAFPFIFSFLFVLAVLLSFVFFFPETIILSGFGFRFKFQLAIVGMLLLSLIVVAAGVIWYNVNNHENRGKEELQSVLKSVSVALERQILPEDLNKKRLLTEMLVDFSEVFWIDINLYDLNGTLLASSRPEIFRKGLLSSQMNTKAYKEMKFNHRATFMHDEQIGELSYLSAYVPLMDMDSNTVAYLNLPYFTRQDKLRKEIIGFIVSFLNLYVFMALISVFIAIVISNRITSPLLTIREKIRGVQFGKANEKIDYFREDEIGDLVKEYNKKVDELAESAQLLAHSERESAWREMARQIAHEIKNPLTPMKLNIQYLQRAKSEKRPEYEEFFYKVTKSLIEQIDLLSSIASSFSDFANISRSIPEKVDLKGILKETRNLFHTTKNIKISFHSNIEKAYVMGDREQLSRVFINLVKNATQAIPEGREGKIEIELWKEDHYAIVSVKDNGVGISREAREKLFFPNFTTKTSGMGLGLALVKSMIESLNGKIWYLTKENEGTTFYVKIPVVDEGEG